MKDYLLAIAVVAVGVLAYLYFRQDEKLNKFVYNEKLMRAKIDSVTQLQHRADLEAIKMATELNVAKVQLAEQKRQTEYATKKYHALKNAPRVILSDSAIDAKIARLYPNR